MKAVLDANKSGLILGTFFVVLHVIWSVLVAVGLARYLINFAASLHFLSVVLTIQPFNILNALMLVVVAFIAGYILGAIFAKVVNWYSK